MTEKHVILVSIAETFVNAVSDERLAVVALRVLEAEGADACELSITVTDDETVRGLNREYAGEDAVTDVLSFSQREGEEFVAPPEGVPPLGEVVIAYPQALRQAQDRQAQSARGWSIEREIERLLVHGVLHLLGYDHAEPEEARRMREREEALARDDDPT
jgi:probable rRNA maturation factor